MPLDAPAVAALAREFQAKLPLKVDRIYQPYPDEFLINLFGAGLSSRLLISVHAQFGRIHFFEGIRENPINPTSFCMLLRKHFGGAKLVSCESVSFERVLKLEFEAYDPYSGLGRKSIWLELTGKSANLILVDQRNTIIDVWRKTVKTSDRELIPGILYQLPATGTRWKPVTVTASQFHVLLSQVPPEIALEKYFLKHWYGLSSLAVSEITQTASLSPKTPCGTALHHSQALYDTFLAWSEMISGENFSPTGLFDQNDMIRDYAAFPIHFPPTGLTARPIDCLNQAVATVANRCHEVNRFQLQQQSLLKKLGSRLEKDQTKLSKQEAEAMTAEQADEWRISGELLTIYQNQISRGSKSIRLLNHYDPEGLEIEIALNPAFTPLGNAQYYFKKYHKAKKGRQEIALQIGKTRANIDYLETVITLAERAISEVDLKMVADELSQTMTPTPILPKNSRSAKKEPAPIEPRRFLTPAGHQLLVGRNNLQNDKLTFKIAAPDDIWFHTQKIPGSHVILKAKPGNLVDDETLNLACQLAAYFSKAKGSTKIPVDYTERKNVKKPPGSKPGFVIYDHFKTAIITPDEQVLLSFGLPL